MALREVHQRSALFASTQTVAYAATSDIPRSAPIQTPARLPEAAPIPKAKSIPEAKPIPEPAPIPEPGVYAWAMQFDLPAPSRGSQR